MIAALRNSISRYVIWEGPDQIYPDWFNDSILPKIPDGQLFDNRIISNSYFKVTENSVHFEENGMILIPGYDVFIKRGRRVFRTRYPMFDKLYCHEELGVNVCALKSDCILYHWFDPSVPLHETPAWIRDEVIDGRIFEFYDGAWYYYEDEGDIAISPYSVFLRNKKDEIKHIELDTFLNVYYSEQTMFLMYDEL